VLVQSCVVPVPHVVACWHSVDPVSCSLPPRIEIAREPQHTDPLGQVVAVHATATLAQALCASQEGFPAPSQHTLGGVQTFVPHGKVLPGTVTTPPLLPLPPPLPPPLLPEALPEVPSGPPSLPLLLIEPLHAATPMAAVAPSASTQDCQLLIEVTSFNVALTRAGI
jgi:hypothetical protein